MVYFRLLIIGYFEGLSSERAIAYRSADGLCLWELLGFDLTKTTPDYSTLSVWRKRLEVSTCHELFRRVVAIIVVREEYLRILLAFYFKPDPIFLDTDLQ